MKELNLLEEHNFWHGINKEPNNEVVADGIIEFLNEL